MTDGVAGGIIGGVLNIGSQFINNAQQNKRDHDARMFAGTQAAEQDAREWSHWFAQNGRDDQVWKRQNEYNLQLWDKQNEYNSPQAQMQRYKEAGLNENLIYGESNAGGSIATANLESHSSHPGARSGDWKPTPVNYNLNDGLLAYMDIRARTAQIDNVKAQTEVAKQDALLRAVESAKVAQDTATGGATEANLRFDLGQKSELAQTSIDAARANLRKTQVETDISLSRNEREIALSKASIARNTNRFQIYVANVPTWR